MEQLNRRKLRAWKIVLGTTLFCQFAVSSRADDTAAQITELRKQIQALSEKVNDLEFQQATGSTNQDQLAVTNKTATNEVPPSKAPPFITAGADGFSLQSADTNFTLKLKGFGQVDAHYYGSSATAKDTFTIRRLRAIASGTVYRNFDYYMQVDFASGITSTTTNNSFLQDA